MHKLKHIFILLALLIVLNGCAGVSPTVFLNYEYNFNFVERVAVIPFENLTADQTANSVATRYFINELLATNAFDIVEPGEVSRVMKKLSIGNTAQLTKEQSVALGKELKTQAIFLGSVGESSTSRSGTSTLNIVTITARLVETEQGSTIWSATNTEGGKGFWGKIFGSSSKSKSEITRKCIHELLGTLID